MSVNLDSRSTDICMFSDKGLPVELAQPLQLDKYYPISVLKVPNKIKSDSELPKSISNPNIITKSFELIGSKQTNKIEDMENILDSYNLSELEELHETATKLLLLSKPKEQNQYSDTTDLSDVLACEDENKFKEFDDPYDNNNIIFYSIFLKRYVSVPKTINSKNRPNRKNKIRKFNPCNSYHPYHINQKEQSDQLDKLDQLDQLTECDDLSNKPVKIRNRSYSSAYSNGDHVRILKTLNNCKYYLHEGVITNTGNGFYAVTVDGFDEEIRFRGTELELI